VDNGCGSPPEMFPHNFVNGNWDVEGLADDRRRRVKERECRRRHKDIKEQQPEIEDREEKSDSLLRYRQRGIIQMKNYENRCAMYRVSRLRVFHIILRISINCLSQIYRHIQ